MKKGLTTLLTVAIALVSVQAFGRAPVIQDIPSPIIGNQSGATQATRYVYADAFDLNKWVSDDATPDAQLKWSYEVVGPQRYSINGNGPLAASDNPIAPPAAKTIVGPGALLNSQHANAAEGLGADLTTSTITIRDILLYPYATNVPSTSQLPADIGMFSQVVTFWCSDGELATPEDVLFYTDNQYTNNQPTGWNRLSGGYVPQVGTEVVRDAKPDIWKRDLSLWIGVTTSTYKGKGLCLNVPMTGLNWGAYGSIQPYFTMTPNTIYRIRLTMNCTQATPGKTPFWDFLLENFSLTGTGMNLYGMDAMIMDNHGSANSVISSELGSEVTLYWAPAAYQTTQWNTGVFTAARASRRDPCLRFRVMDVDTPNVPNNQRAGGICLQSVVIEAIPANTLSVIENVYTATSLKSVPDTGTDLTSNIWASSLLSSILNFNNPAGALTVTPSAPGTAVDIVTVVPAKDKTIEPAASNAILDDYPIEWESDTIYRFEAELSAPDATNENVPWDVLWMTMESATNELITDSYVTATGDGTATSMAMPKAVTSAGQTGPQKYAMFFYSGKATNSPVTQFKNLRWRLRFGNAPAPINWPNGQTANIGTVRLHSVKVDKVDFVE
jgi:hypothetical protein